MFHCEAFPIENGTGQTRQVVKLTGAATIGDVARGRELILEALAAGNEVLIDGGSLESVDFSWLQLLCSAHRSAESSGKRLSFAAAGSAVTQAAEAAGFSRRQGCSASQGSKACLWACGGCSPQRGEHA